MAEEESQKKQQYGIIHELLTESNRLREELHNLRCLTKIKAEERGQKHRDLLRAEVQHKHTHARIHTCKQARNQSSCDVCMVDENDLIATHLC